MPSSSFSANSSDSSHRIELEYGWEFLPDPSGRLQFRDLETATGWRPAKVGLSWHVQFEDLRDYLGAAWYRTQFEAPEFAGTRHVLLKFGAVDYFSEIFINGTSVGRHEGGYTPFSFEITSLVHRGTNDLVVRVIDPPMDEQQNYSQFPDLMYNEIPHGKQNWYVQNGGIWQGVRLEFCPAIYVDRVDVTPKISGEFQADVRSAGTGLIAEGGVVAANCMIRASIFDVNGRTVFEATQPLAGQSRISIAGQVRSPRLWSSENPSLYVAEIAIEGAVQYRRRVRFGFRSFETHDGKLYFNGKPFYMMAALDQDFYPETIHSPASAEVVRDMMLKAKRLGINVLRCHLKVAHPVYLDTADELGMLVWAELPSWSDCWFPSDHFSIKAAVRGQLMFEEILARDWNHPCIVVQTIMNESWGINLREADQRQWLRKTFDHIKQTLAPLGRLVVDNSACENNFHIKTDIEDFHQYYSVPDQRRQWDTWLAELASRPSWTFSPYGDAERTGSEPLLVSEFGNWGLPELPAELPWWFHRNFGDREVTRPSGVLERFYEFKYDHIFADYNDLAHETQWHQFISLKYEIESIRRHSSIQGYVITGMTDVHWEANGLLDMWRNPKVFADELRLLQQPDCLLCDFERRNYFSGEEVRAQVLISHYSSADFKGARLRWSTDSGEVGSRILTSTVAPGELAELGEIRFNAPAVEEARVEWLRVELRSATGSRITENTYEIFCFPAARGGEADLGIHPSVAAELLDGLQSAGYEVQPFRSRAAQGNGIVLTSRLDDEVEQHLAAGGRALVLVNDEAALPEGCGIIIKRRTGSELDGRWFSNYNWIKHAQPPFNSVAFTRILGFESEHVVPEFVMQGIPGEHFDDVLAGITLGWLNLNSGLALKANCGAGVALITTFRFNAYGRDPYATHLLDSMLRYLRQVDASPGFALASVAQQHVG